MNQMLKLATGLFLVLGLAACSSSGSVTVEQAKAAAIPSGKVVALAITAPADEDSRDVAQRLRSELFGRLVSEAVFKQVVPQEEPADYKMDVGLTEVDEVSQGARIFWGVMAGSNTLKGTVALTDETTGQLVTKFDIAGESASHPLSSENEMDDAIREAVTRIIATLR
jgi:hypothetical protein